MSKRKKKGLRSEARTCFIFALVFIVLGIGSIAYGKLFYGSDDMVTLDDIMTGQTATIVSVDKRERSLSHKEQEDEKKNGRSENEIKWEYHIVYSVDADGQEYTYNEIRPYLEGKPAPKEGDTEVINYAIKNGEIIPHPETKETNNAVICGWALVILSVVAAGIGLFLNKR